MQVLELPVDTGGLYISLYSVAYKVIETQVSLESEKEPILSSY